MSIIEKRKYLNILRGYHELLLKEIREDSEKLILKEIESFLFRLLSQGFPIAGIRSAISPYFSSDTWGDKYPLFGEALNKAIEQSGAKDEQAT